MSRAMNSKFLSKVLYLIAGMFLVNIAGCYPNPLQQSQEGKLQETVKINQYMYRSFLRPDGEYYFEISRNSHKVFSDAGSRIMNYHVNSKGEKDNIPPAGKDVTGDGLPDLVIESYSGGAHCCFTYFVFSLGEEFKKIAQIEGYDSQFEFADLDGDNVPDIRGRDMTFRYWETSFAESPAPVIILRYDGETYSLATTLMKQPYPSGSEYTRKFQEIKKTEEWREGRVPPILWGYMLDLIYTGNGELAWKIIDTAWPKKRKGKKEFLTKFKEKLSEGPYWEDLKVMNNWH